LSQNSLGNLILADHVLIELNQTKSKTENEVNLMFFYNSYFVYGRLKKLTIILALYRE